MSKKDIQYITAGRLWAWGWHRYEVRTMIILLTTMATLAVIGILFAAYLGISQSLPIGTTIIVAVVAGILGAVIGSAVVKSIAPVIWSLVTTKELE